MTDERVKLLLTHTEGIVITLGFLFLAGHIALGNVEEKSSFGLSIILGGLGVVLGQYAAWAFHSTYPDKDKHREEP